MHAAPTDVFLHEFDEGKPYGVCPFRELVGNLVWLVNQKRPDVPNAVRAVAGFCACPQAQALQCCGRDSRIRQGDEKLR